MENGTRPSGIECMGNVPWGTHLCQFYESKQDLVDVLGPYFRAGLENNEFCMWITSEPLAAEEAEAAAREVIPGFDRYLQRGQIEILSYSDWYLKGGVFDAQRVLDGWAEKLSAAQARGFAGLRLTGNTFWLERASWEVFVDYEEQIERVIGSLPMIALCSYSLQRCGGSDVVDVLRNHRFALIRQHGSWQLVENSEVKRTKEALQESEARFRWLAENAPDIILRFEFTPEPRISYVSPAVADTLGYDPEELYTDIGVLIESVLPQDRGAFRKLLDGHSVAEPTTIGCRHKQGKQVWLELRVAPLHNDRGQLLALEGIARDVTERWWAEEKLRLIAEASSTLASSLDYETTLASIAGLAVPRIADWCAVDVVDEGGSIQLLALAHLDSEKGKWARELRRRYPVDPNAPAGVPRVMRTGQPELYSEIPDSIEELRCLRELGCRSAMVVPLQSHGRTLGAITLASSESGRCYGQDDLELAMELARRAAAATDNARLYRDRERTGQELRETRDYLEKLVNYANAPIIVWDPAFRITQFNHAFERLTGYRAEEALGQDLAMLFPETSRRASLGKIARTLEGEYWESVEIPILRKDGDIRLALWNSANIHAEDGKTLLATIAQGQDITERKLAEEGLRETRDYLENLFDYANAPIIVWDPGFRITRFNHAFERLTGHRADEVIGQPLSMLFPQASQEESLRKIARTLEGEHWESVEIPILRKDGEVRVALWNSANLHTDDGKTLLATIAQGQDITERKLAEEALRDSEERYRLLVDGARDYAIVMLDPEGRVASWSSGAERVKGYREEEVLGKSISLFYTPEDVEQGKPEQGLAVAAAEGRFEDQGWRVRKDRSRFWADVIITALPDGGGGLRGFSKVTRDVTDRRRSEEELRKLSRAVEQSPATVVITDTQGSIEYANPKFQETTGYTPEEARGKNPRILKSGHSTQEEYRQLWRTIKAGGEWRGEFLNKKKNGEMYWESASISPIRDSDETITHFLAVKEDITERKRTEGEIRKLNADLTQRAQELDAINKELESFSYSVSHDLRAPLRGIDGFSQALLEEYGDRLDDQGKQYLNRVRAASQRMARLIDDMLTLSRLTRSEMVREEIDLTAMAEDAMSDLRKAEPGRQVETLIEPNVVACGDARLLAAVLENLIGNAWKFTSKHPRARVEFGTTTQDGEKVYFVRDDGAGFDMAYADKLFGTFQRLHSQTEFSGTGIGLATVQRIIRRHGGRVWAEGVPEQGATFYFTLGTRCDGESDKEGCL